MRPLPQRRVLRLESCIPSIDRVDGGIGTNLVQSPSGPQADIERAGLLAAVEQSARRHASRTLDGTIVSWNKGAEALLRYAGVIETSGLALLFLIDNILDLSKIEAHKITLEHVDFDLRCTVEDAVQTVRRGDERLSLETARPAPARGSACEAASRVRLSTARQFRLSHVE
jgi:signal transduction histidine kinase